MATAGLLGLVNFIGIVWMIVDVLGSDREDIEKLLWAIIIIFVPFGWIIYFILGRRRRILQE